MQRRTNPDRTGYARLVAAMCLSAASDLDLGWLHSRDCASLLDLAGLPQDTGAQLLRRGRFRSGAIMRLRYG